MQKHYHFVCLLGKQSSSEQNLELWIPALASIFHSPFADSAMCNHSLGAIIFACIHLLHSSLGGENPKQRGPSLPASLKLPLSEAWSRYAISKTIGMAIKITFPLRSILLFEYLFSLYASLRVSIWQVFSLWFLLCLVIIFTLNLCCISWWLSRVATPPPNTGLSH